MSSDRLSDALLWAALAALLYLLFLVVQPFLTPLGWAGVMAIVFYPMHERLEQRWGGGRSAAITTLAAALLVIVPLLLVTAAFVREAIDAAAGLQSAFLDGRLAWIERAWRALEHRVPAAQRLDVAVLVTDTAKRGAMLLAAQSGAVLVNVVGFTFSLVIALFATFFVLRDSRVIMATV
ncbi:MAG: AI-2E family transporter, partial [Acidobacteriota bacterium]